MIKRMIKKKRKKRKKKYRREVKRLNFYNFRRYELGVSIIEMAKQTKLDKGTLSKIERGLVKEPRPYTIARIRDAYKLTSTQLAHLFEIPNSF